MASFDWVIVFIIAVNAALGLVTGLFTGVLRLATSALALVGWFLIGRATAGLLPAADPWAAIGAMVAGGLVAALLSSLLTGLVAARVMPWLRARPGLARLDHLLGVVPGAVTGLVIAFVVAWGVGRVAPTELTPHTRRLLEAGRHPAEALLAAVPTAWPGVAIGPDGLVVVPAADRVAAGPVVAPDQVEKLMLALVNAERRKVGLRSLAWDGALAVVARTHSRDMLKRNYFAHADPQGHTAATRVARAGIRYRTLGENLAFAPTLAIAHQGLMRSPGHRENILRPAFGRLGIGIVRLPPGARYTPKGSETALALPGRVAQGSLIVTQLFRD